MRKLLLSVTLLLLTNAPAAAQGSAAADADGRLDVVRGEAARLLESQANGDRAWGAYLAGHGGLKDLEPALVRTLSDPALADGPEEKIVRRAALDALIRLGARVPAEHLRALPQDFADEVLILLASAPKENRDALLETFAALAGDSGLDARWLAAGNLLAETEARGFAALLLRDLKVEANVAVVDWHGNNGFGTGGGGGGGCGGSYKGPAGFPPVSYYALTGEVGRGAVVVAPGRRPVFYVRSTSPYVGCGHSTTVVRDVVRVEYLTELLNTSPDFDARPSDSVVCTDARQCRGELVGLRTRIEQAYAAMVGLLVEKGHLDAPGDAPASPPISFMLWDERRRRTFPLPDKLKGVTILIHDTEPDEDDGDEVEEP
jgi:hypothetical protein